MTYVKALIDELDAVLDGASTQRCAAVLRAVTSLFLEHAANCNPEQIAVFDAILIALVQKVERQSLIELSERLAGTDRAPAKVIRRLSSDNDIAVAGSVLETSSALADADIVEIAKTKGAGHLLAIANRAQINEAATDILINRGSAEIMRKIIANEKARISHVGFVKLLSEAKHDRKLATLAASRHDMPDELQPFLKLALERA